MRKIKALTSFSGIISMCVGETRNVDDDTVVADLLRAGYVEEIGNPAEAVEAENPTDSEEAQQPAEVEEVKPANGRTKKTATKTED